LRRASGSDPESDRNDHSPEKITSQQRRGECCNAYDYRADRNGGLRSQRGKRNHGRGTGPNTGAAGSSFAEYAATHGERTASHCSRNIRRDREDSE